MTPIERYGNMNVKTEGKRKTAPTVDPKRPVIDTHRLLSMIPLLPYHHVADIRCGLGDFTIPLCKYLFDGKVHAIDNDKNMINATRTAVESLHLTNINLTLSEGKNIPLDDDSIDGALLALVLEGKTGRAALLKEAKRCLKKSGWLAIIEWYKKKTDHGPPQKQRIDQDKMIDIAQKQGFRLSSSRALNSEHYIVLLRK